MADKGMGGGDWTAGIVAIVAALLLGSAVPIGLYFGLYQPKVREHAAAKKNLIDLQGKMQSALEKSKKVKTLEDEANTIAGEIEKVEEPFTRISASETERSEAQNFLETIAAKYALDLVPERKSQLGAHVISRAGGRIPFENGLWATKFRIEAQAYYHDFARFVTDMEMASNFVFVPEMLIARGDSNGGSAHNFMMDVYVIEKRDIDQIGR